MQLVAISAVSQKNQKTVNAFIKSDRKYNELVNIGFEGGRQGEITHGRALDLFVSLPQGEQRNLVKRYRGFYGYECVGA